MHDAHDAAGDVSAPDAIRAVEGEVSELMSRVRRTTLKHAEGVSPGLIPGVYRLFTLIVQHGPITSSEVAERMSLDKGQVSRGVRELERLSLVQRHPDRADRRVSLLEATADGRAKLEAVRAAHQGELRTALHRWDEADIWQLANLLAALRTRTSPSAHLSSAPAVNG